MTEPTVTMPAEPGMPIGWSQASDGTWSPPRVVPAWVGPSHATSARANPPIASLVLGIL